MNKKFNFESYFSKSSIEAEIPKTLHAKYDFAVAYPPPETIPLDGLLDGLKEGLLREGKDLAYYPDPLGALSIRELVTEKLKQDRDIDSTPDEIMITQGSSEAINLVIQSLTDPGDTVITEEFVYVGTLRQLRRAKADVVGSKLDENGLIPEELEILVKKLIKEGKRIKYIYTIPEFQNPTGSTLLLERRIKILKIAEKYNIPLLEDDCYVDLRFEGDTQPSFKSLDTIGLVTHVASFSKLLAPGLRMGYVLADNSLLKRMISFKASQSSHFVSLAIEGFLIKNMDQHKSNVSEILRKKCNAMIGALGENLGGIGAKWSQPGGGCYVWLTMPEEINLMKLQDVFFEKGVGFIPGPSFSPEGLGHNCARLCFAYESPENNREGINLFGEILHELNLI